MSRLTSQDVLRMIREGQPPLALSLWQPWAQLLVAGTKRHETRSWFTHVRGPLVIHAARGDAKTGELAELQLGLARLVGRPWSQIPRGTIVGVVNVTECRATASVRDQLDAAELNLGDFGAGRFAWRCEPVAEFRDGLGTKVRGRQGLWRLEQAELDALALALEAAAERAGAS